MQQPAPPNSSSGHSQFLVPPSVQPGPMLRPSPSTNIQQQQQQQMPPPLLVGYDQRQQQQTGNNNFGVADQQHLNHQMQQLPSDASSSSPFLGNNHAHYPLNNNVSMHQMVYPPPPAFLQGDLPTNGNGNIAHQQFAVGTFVPNDTTMQTAMRFVGQGDKPTAGGMDAKTGSEENGRQAISSNGNGISSKTATTTTRSGIKMEMANNNSNGLIRTDNNNIQQQQQRNLANPATNLLAAPATATVGGGTSPIVPPPNAFPPSAQFAAGSYPTAAMQAATGTAFGTFDPITMGGQQQPDYLSAAAWANQMPTVGGYPGISCGTPMASMAMGGCLGPVVDDMGLGGMYAPNALMALQTGGGGQLQYELDPMTSAYGVWPGSGAYYLGMTDQQGKLLTTEAAGGYMNGVGQMANGGLDPYDPSSNHALAASAPLPAAPPPAFYGNLHQGISPSASGQTILDPSSTAFPTGVSTLPPPPSQLASTDQLYGTQNGFPPLTVLPPNQQQQQQQSLATGNGTMLQLDHHLASVVGQSQQQQFYDAQQSMEMFGQAQQQQQQMANQAANSFSMPPVATKSPPPSGRKGRGGKRSLSALGGGGKRSAAAKAHLKRTAEQNSNNNRPSTSTADASTASNQIGGKESDGGELISSAHQQQQQQSVNVNNKLTALAAAILAPGQQQHQRRISRSRSVTTKESEDDEKSEEREQERRSANNTRERIRVRDINAAFKELARLCCQHMPNVEERGLTKLGTLLKAVELIPLLEKQVEDKNRSVLDPRRECLKQRLAIAASNSSIAAAGPPTMQHIDNGIVSPSQFHHTTGGPSCSTLMPLSSAPLPPSAIQPLGNSAPHHVQHQQQAQLSFN